MLRNSKNRIFNGKHSPMVGAFLFLIAVVLGAKVDIDVGGVLSFTLQTLFLGLAYYYLSVQWRVALIFVYLALGLCGVPVFNGEASWSYFISWPLGFFLGFVASAFIPVLPPRGFRSAVHFLAHVHGIIIICGIVWVGIHAGSAIAALDTLIAILPGAFLKTFVGAGLVWVAKRYFSGQQLQ